MKKRLILVLLLSCCVLFCGCLNPKTPDEYGYVLSIGMDYGKSRKYMYTFMMQQESSSSDSQSGSGTSVIISAEGDTIFDAISVLHSGVPYNLNFSRTNIIVFSDETAKAGEIESFFGASLNALKIRQSVKLIVSLCSAEDYLNGMKALNSPNVTKLQYNLMQNNTVDGTIPVTNYTLFYAGANSGRYDAAVTLGAIDKSASDETNLGDTEQKEEKSAEQKSGSGDNGDEQSEQSGRDEKNTDTTAGVLRKGGMQSYASGTALFDGYVMQGTLNAEETKLLLMMKGELDNATFGIEYDEYGLVLFRLHRNKRRRVVFDVQNNSADVDVYFNCDVEQDASGEAAKNWSNGVRDTLCASLESGMQDAFSTCKKLKSDAAEFGKEAVKAFKTVKSWKEYNWKEKYASLEATFRIHINLNDEEIETNVE